MTGIAISNQKDGSLKKYRWGGSRISGKGVQMYKGRGFALTILSYFSLISHENEIIWSH